MLMLLGGMVLVLAVAGVAWALRGSDKNRTQAQAAGKRVSTSAPTTAFIGPKMPAGPTATPKVIGPVAGPKAPTPAATATATSAPPAAKPPVTTPPATSPGTGTGSSAGSGSGAGGGATVTHRFTVHRGDTMWDMTRTELASTGRSTSIANLAKFVTRFYAANSSIVGANPNVIHPGQVLVWPVGL